MTKTLLLTVSLLTVCLSIHAQKSFPGFYITANGETVTGSFPQFREWKHNPSKVIFETGSKQKVELTPLTCRSFTITGYDTYESAEVKRMTNPIKFEHINTWETGDEAYEALSVFLRKIYESNAITLYEYSDSKRNNYFTKTSDGISELFFKVDYKDGQVIQDRRFAVQLQSIFASNIENDKKLQNKLTRLRYNEKDLVSFFNDIYNATNKEKTRTKYPNEFIITGGISHNARKTTPNDGFVGGITKVTFPSAISPSFGVGFINYGQRSFGRNFIAIELKYTGFQHSYKKSENDKWEYKTQIIAPGFSIGRKWINQKNIAWYTSINTSVLVMLKNHETRHFQSSVRKEKGRNAVINFGFQTGFLFKHLGVWAQFNPRFVTHDYLGYSTKIIASQVGISFRFHSKKNHAF